MTKIRNLLFKFNDQTLTLNQLIIRNKYRILIIINSILYQQSILQQYLTQKIEEILFNIKTSTMIKSLKVKKLIDQNGIEIQNFTMVIRLKKIIEQLNEKIKQQDQSIMSLKRDSKTTKINQMQVEIQHLNDQNKRLTLMIEENKQKFKRQLIHLQLKMTSQSNDINVPLGNFSVGNSKENFRVVNSTKKKTKKGKNSIKKDSHLSSMTSSLTFNYQTTMSASGFMNQQNRRPFQQCNDKDKQQMVHIQQRQKKYERKYYQLLEQTQLLKKQLINLKIYESTSTANRKRKSININQKGSLTLQKNMQSIQKLTQKKHDLEAENQLLRKKYIDNEKRTKQLQAETINLRLKVDQLRIEMKCKNLMVSEKVLSPGNRTQRSVFIKEPLINKQQIIRQVSIEGEKQIEIQ